MFKRMTTAKVNDLHFKYDEKTGLKAIIAIHNTLLGPALGGCRIIEYQNTDQAIDDAIRLAKGMSYKAALANLPLGGGKAVILKPIKIKDRALLFEAFGRFVNELGGRYITAMDAGTTTEDMDAIASQTQYVTCTSTGGNPAPYTALGVFNGIKACLKLKGHQTTNLKGVHVAIQGLGNVGYELARLLYENDARLTVADIDKTKLARCINEFNATAAPADAIHKVNCDIFSPCGLGSILSKSAINELNCQIVAGSANNQLALPHCGEFIHQRNILYAPDYLINAGGLMFVALQHKGAKLDAIKKKIEEIGTTLHTLLKRSLSQNIPSSEIADHMAEEVLYSSQQSNRPAV
ncbi:Leu/Phe/Val dehydrogenase [Spartinivicinus poritis]|uniref:Amino acid dehydrogenase n=1 Tax=Spartinivicinus poritis TaxID=2994640 RepID=A0ABT5UB73_9GAMM|nr:Glu/Leu/Phe/Val dehydrogenase dimerization domain-containing protein [Spartinivicinus sp. A2-2]MDE1463608.1 amino acid dehydrogenase [Spartinivicinus sp. A2-2]